MVGRRVSRINTPAAGSRLRSLAKGVRTAYKYRKQIWRAGRETGKHVRKHWRKLFSQQPKRQRVGKYQPPIHGTEGHSGMDTSLVKVHYGKPKHSKMTMGKWLYHESRAGFITSVAGKQGAFDIQFYCTPNQMCQTSTIANPDTVSSNIGLMDLNPYNKTTGSRVLTGIQPLEDRFYLRGFETEMEITNFSNVGAFLEIRLLRCKKSSNYGAATGPNLSWNQGYLNEAYGQAARTGGAVGTGVGAVGGYSDLEDVGANPKESPLFRQIWEVVAEKKLLITSAGTEKIKFDVFCDRIIKQDIQKPYIDGNVQYVSRQTYALHVVSRGSIVLDSTVSVAAEVPTYGATRLGYVLNTKYHACAVKGNSGRLNSNRAYMNNAYGTIVANQRVLDEIDAAGAIDQV